jgi:hypothetical protein
MAVPQFISVVQVGPNTGETVPAMPPGEAPIGTWDVTVTVPPGNPVALNTGKTTITLRFTGTLASARQQMIEFLNHQFGY